MREGASRFGEFQSNDIRNWCRCVRDIRRATLTPDVAGGHKEEPSAWSHCHLCCCCGSYYRGNLPVSHRDSDVRCGIDLERQIRTKIIRGVIPQQSDCRCSKAQAEHEKCCYPSRSYHSRTISEEFGRIPELAVPVLRLVKANRALG